MQRAAMGMMAEPIDEILTPVALAEMRRDLVAEVQTRVARWTCAQEAAAEHLDIPAAVLAEVLAGRSDAFSLDGLARLSERASSAPRPRPGFGLPGRCAL